MAAGLPEFFQTPVIIWPWCQESYNEHYRYYPPDEFRAPRQQVVGGIHRCFHRDHGDETHAHGSGQGIFEIHAFTHQQDNLKYDAGDQAVDDGQAQDEERVGIYLIKLEKGNGAEIAYGTADQAPHGVVCTFSPGLQAFPKRHWHYQ